MTEAMRSDGAREDGAPQNLVTGRHVSLWDLARTFLVIGATGFGGGMAVIALIQDACVRRKRWLTMEEFSHGIAFGQILGPFAVNTSTFVGYRLRGPIGAVVAAAFFLAPSVIIVIILSDLYFRFHDIPALQSALHGIGPVVVALIVAAAYRIGQGKMRGAEPIVVAMVSFAVSLFWHVPIVVVLAGAAILGMVRHRMRGKGAGDAA